MSCIAGRCCVDGRHGWDCPMSDPLRGMRDARASELARMIQDRVDSRLRQYASDLEAMCARALVDPVGRGVLVVEHEDGSWEMTLDAEVPRATIWRRSKPWPIV